MKKITLVKMEEVRVAGNPFDYAYIPTGKKVECTVNEAEYSFSKKVKWDVQNDLEKVVNAIENGAYEAGTPYTPQFGEGTVRIYHQAKTMYDEKVVEAIDVITLGTKNYSVKFFIEA